MRNYIYTKYSQTYGVNLDEIEKPLVEYKTFSEFFTRKILPRPQYEK
jgi:phosphatidylserine decarboxylase